MKQTVNYFRFGDIVTWRGQYAKANSTPKMVVIEIQPNNGKGGSVICIEEFPFDKNKYADKHAGLFPIVCGPNEIERIP